MTRPFTSHCTRIFRAASGMYSLKHFQQNFRGDGNAGDIRSGGVRNGVGDRGRGAIERQLTDSFGSARTTRVRIFFKKDANRWNVHRSGHDVVGHLGIERAPFLPDDAFIQSEAAALRDAAFDLYESVVWQEGRMLNAQMTNYIMPTSMDVPPIRVFFEENPYARGPGGAKGIGELPLDGTAPPIATAIPPPTATHTPRTPITPHFLLHI